MPGRGNGAGRGNAHGGGGMRPAGPMGHRGNRGSVDRDEHAPEQAGGGSEQVHGRSEQSPGHRKQAAGAQSARDFAPGRAGRAGTPALLDIAPDEVPAADD